MNTNINKSEYTSASGKQVTLYYNTETDMCFTVVDGNISLYARNGDLMCGATSIEAAIKFISK